MKVLVWTSKWSDYAHGSSRVPTGAMQQLAHPLSTWSLEKAYSNMLPRPQFSSALTAVLQSSSIVDWQLLSCSSLSAT